MSYSNSSFLYRAQRKVIIPNCVDHVGITNDGLKANVYYFEGVGYWVAPAYVGIYSVALIGRTTRNILLIGNTAGKHKKHGINRAANAGPRALFDFIIKCLTEYHKNNPIYRGRISNRVNRKRPIMHSNCVETKGGWDISFNLSRVDVCEGTCNKRYIGTARDHDEVMTLTKLAVECSKEYEKDLIQRMTMKLEDVCALHETCPELMASKTAPKQQNTKSDARARRRTKKPTRSKSMSSRTILFDGKLESLGKTEDNRTVYYYPEVNKYWLAPAYVYYRALPKGRISFQYINRYLHTTRHFGSLEGVSFEEHWKALKEKLGPILEEYGCFAKPLYRHVDRMNFSIEERVSGKDTLIYHLPNRRIRVMGSYPKGDLKRLEELKKRAEVVRDEYNQRLFDETTLPLEEAFILLDSNPLEDSE